MTTITDILKTQLDTQKPAPVVEQDYHGSPADRGSADAYYGIQASPHKWPEGTFKGERVVLTDQDEINQYLNAYNSEEDRKVWA